MNMKRIFAVMLIALLLLCTAAPAMALSTITLTLDNVTIKDGVITEGTVWWGDTDYTADFQETLNYTYGTFILGGRSINVEFVLVGKNTIDYTTPSWLDYEIPCAIAVPGAIFFSGSGSLKLITDTPYGIVSSDGAEVACSKLSVKAAQHAIGIIQGELDDLFPSTASYDANVLHKIKDTGAELVLSDTLPSTGDETPLMMLFAALALSIVGIAVLSRKRIIAE
jgi:LPXTG-motif cell wall-anchored protein